MNALYPVLWFLLRGAALFLVLLIALVFFFQGKALFFPTRPMDGTPGDKGLSFEDVRFPAADGILLCGWFVPAAPERSSRGTILFCHGNAGNISHRIESLGIFHEMDLDVFIFDYRGYGGSEGKVTEEGTYRDAEGAWRYLTEKRAVPPERIILFGRSLGGAIAASLARKTNPGGLIVESSFISVPDLAANLYPWLPLRRILRFHYPAGEYLRQVRCPVLVVHSREDEIIPYRHGTALYETAAEPKSFLEIRGGHNDGFFLSGDVYRKGLKDFILRSGGEGAP